MVQTAWLSHTPHHTRPPNTTKQLDPGSCCSTPRTLKDWCEDEGLVPMPEDVGETGLYAQGEEPMLPSPVDGFDEENEEEEGLELDWYGGCSGCDCDGATPADGTPVEGEFGASPRCSFFAGAAAGQDGEEDEDDDDDDPPTDDDIDGLDIEQGGAPLLSAAAAPAPAAAVAALQKPPLAPRGVTQPLAGDRGKRRAVGKPPLTRGTSL